MKYITLILGVFMLGCGESHSDKNSSSEKDATSTVSRQGSPPAIRKILCLHGGGGNVKEFQNSSGVKAISEALGSNYELVFAQAPHGGLWMRDPPEGKSKPTNDPDWASQSISILNSIVQSQGPFYGIMGYSQGAAFIPVYLSRIPDGTFQMAAMFGGYLPTTHQGLITNIKAEAPFGNIRALVWVGGKDWIANENLATPFNNPTVIRDLKAGHVVPSRSNTTFNRVIQLIKNDSKESATGEPSSGFLKTKANAEAGDANAQNHLGGMYDVGFGVPEDDQEAVKWNRKAAAQGSSQAKTQLDNLLKLNPKLQEK